MVAGVTASQASCVNRLPHPYAIAPASQNGPTSQNGHAPGDCAFAAVIHRTHPPIHLVHHARPPRAENLMNRSVDCALMGELNDFANVKTNVDTYYTLCRNAG
ncbi:hypothetical protein B0H16DRAFT_1710146 [Mycena metata]|uniref:Uncharacterized protein n=1 Tax=Mycena metata TaxID=1033252 RepID=A0AAD7KDJ8_9AGAR|nr:hypothetical protein B0H16DRAFT_1710146 [Mycena metata]